MKNSILKLIIPVPYSIFEVKADYKKTKPLTETEALIVILIATAEKDQKEIKATNNFSELFKEKYNIEDKFLELFKKSYQSLIDNKVISNSDEKTKFDEIRIGNLKINKDILRHLDDGNFFGLEKEIITKKSVFWSNLLADPSINIKENNKKRPLRSSENDIKIWIDKNQKLNANYDSIIEVELQKNHKNFNNNEILVDLKISNEDGEVISIKNMNNISFFEEIIEFNLSENRIFPTESRGTEVLNLFNKDIYYKDFINIIETSLKPKIEPQINDNQSLEYFDFEQDENNIHEIEMNNEISFFTLENSELFEIFRNQKSFNLKINKEYKINYFELVKMESDDLGIFLEIFRRNNEIFLKLNDSKKTDIFKRIIKNFNLLIENEWIIKNNIESILKIIYNEMQPNVLFDIIRKEYGFFGKNKRLINDLFKLDSVKEKKYLNLLKDNSLMSLIDDQDIIGWYELNYENNNSFLNNSSIEREILSLWSDYKVINDSNLKPSQTLEKFKNLEKKISDFSNRKTKLKYLMGVLKHEILIKKLITEEDIKKEVNNLVLETRKSFEKLLNDGNLELFLTEFYKENKQRKESIRKQWKMNHDFIHYNPKIKYNDEDLQKAIQINEFFSKVEIEIKKMKEEK